MRDTGLHASLAQQMEAPMFTSAPTEHNSLFGNLAGWWRDLRRRRADLLELENTGNLNAVAQDAGLSVSDLRRLVAGPADAAELKRRMAALGLDPASVSRREPAVARDLQRTCCLCTSKRRCRHDLTANPADSGWKKYCPNATTLSALPTQSQT
jgi:hypothetical protein